MELARRVVLSTITYNRASVLALFQDPANLTPQGGLTVKRCAEGTGLSDAGAEGLIKELVDLNILEKDDSHKQHEYKPLPKFIEIIAKPIESMDHIADLTVGGVNSTIDETSETTQPYEKASEFGPKD